MAKIKHSKFKNTGFIFELLTRQIASDVLTSKKNTSLTLIRKYFKEGSELYKELMLYKALSEFKSKNSSSIDKMITLSKDAYTKLNRLQLNKEKYSLIKEIKNEYLTEGFFDSRIGNYKTYATIYKLFESSMDNNIAEFMQCYDYLVEASSGAKKVVTEKPIADILSEQTPEIKKLATKLIIEKFNSKYQNLNSKQRTLISRYINENVQLDPFRNYVYSEVNYINKKMDEIVKSESDQVLKLKISEVKKLTNEILKSRLIKDSHISAMLKFYELIDASL